MGWRSSSATGRTGRGGSSPRSSDGSSGTAAEALDGFPVRPMLVLCAAQLIFVAAFQMVSIALPEIQADLRVDDADLQWVNSALALALAAAILPAGRLVDRLGGRTVFRVGAAGLVGSNLAAGASGTIGQLAAARAVQGAALALLLTAMFALITRLTPAPGDRVRAFAWWGVAGSVGGGAGVVVGGALLSAVGWEAIFLLVGAATLPVLVLTRALPGTDGDPRRPLDLPGAALAAGVMTAAVLGLVRLTAGDPLGAALLGVAAALAVGLAAVDRRAAEPLLPTDAETRAPLVRVGVISVLQAAVTNTPLYFFAIAMQELDGYSAAATGLAFLPCNVALVVGSALGGRLVPRVAAARTTAVGLGVVAAGHAVMARLPDADGYLTGWLPGTVLVGLGLGVSQVAVATAMSSGVPAGSAGLASSMLNATSQLGTAAGLALFVGVAAAAGGDLGTSAAPYRWVFAAGAAIAVASTAAALGLVRTGRAERRANRTGSPAAAGHPAR